MTTAITLTPAEEALLKQKMEQILRLLELSSMPDEVKESWLTLLPDMDLEQVDRLVAILEKELQENMNASSQHPEDQKLLNQLEDASKTYQANLAQSAATAEQALKEIEDELPPV